MRLNRNDFSKMAIIMAGKDVNSAACVAVAAAMDNDMWENATHEQRTDWIGLSCNIEILMRGDDEPRFTVYDYLDAVINGDMGDWQAFAAKVQTAIDENNDGLMKSYMDDLTAMAVKKRRTYSAEFN